MIFVMPISIVIAIVATLCIVKLYYKEAGTLKIDKSGEKDKYCLEIRIPIEKLEKYNRIVLKVDSHASL